MRTKVTLKDQNGNILAYDGIPVPGEIVELRGHKYRVGQMVEAKFEVTVLPADFVEVIAEVGTRKARNPEAERPARAARAPRPPRAPRSGRATTLTRTASRR